MLYAGRLKSLLSRYISVMSNPLIDGLCVNSLVFFYSPAYASHPAIVYDKKDSARRNIFKVTKLYCWSNWMITNIMVNGSPIAHIGLILMYIHVQLFFEVSPYFTNYV